MDVALRFWSEKKGQVETKYYDSEFLTRSNAENSYSRVEILFIGHSKMDLKNFP